MTISNYGKRPLVPRNCAETKALVKAHEKPVIFRKPLGGNPTPAFNGSQTSRRNKKRPITLPERA